jgi:hypothetical protein
MRLAWSISPGISGGGVRGLMVARAQRSSLRNFACLFWILRNGSKAANGCGLPKIFGRALRDRPIAATAFDELRRRRMKILKRGKQLGELSIHRRHKLRIQAKKLRYAAEFFAAAYPGKNAVRRREQFVSRLEKLQDALGEMNDIAVHENLTESVANIHDDNNRRHHARSKKAFAAGRLSGREEARMASVLKGAEKAFRVFAKADPFWI